MAQSFSERYQSQHNSMHLRPRQDELKINSMDAFTSMPAQAKCRPVSRLDSIEVFAGSQSRFLGGTALSESLFDLYAETLHRSLTLKACSGRDQEVPLVRRGREREGRGRKRKRERERERYRCI